MKMSWQWLASASCFILEKVSTEEELIPLTYPKLSSRYRTLGSGSGFQPGAHMREQGIRGAEENVSLQLKDVDGIPVLLQDFFLRVRALNIAVVFGPGHFVPDGIDPAVIEREQHAGEHQADGHARAKIR